jgi:hypothetical protein
LGESGREIAGAGEAVGMKPMRALTMRKKGHWIKATEENFDMAAETGRTEGAKYRLKPGP